MPDSLFKLLRDADSAIVPTLDEDLVRSVYRRHRLRQATRATAAVCLVAAVGIGTALFMQSNPTPQPRLVTSQPARVSAPDMQLIALEAELDLHTRTADLLLAGERRRQSIQKSQRTLDQEDALDDIQRQRNRAALTLVSQGDRMAAQPERTTEAVEAYRRTIELFPDTSAATIAAERLAQLEM